MKDYIEALCRSMSYLGLLGAPEDPGQVACVHLPPRGCFVILNAAQPGPGPSPGSKDLLLLERMLRATESGLQTVLGDKLSTVWVILQQRGRGSSYRAVCGCCALMVPPPLFGEQMGHCSTLGF